MRVTKSKRFWVTTGIVVSVIPVIYLAIMYAMPQVAMAALLGVFFSQGIYVHQETKNPSKKADAELDKGE